MELQVTSEDFDPFPKADVFRPLGLLNSNYQRIVKKNYSDTTSHSVFGIRQRLKHAQYKFTSGVAVFLKVLTFATVIVAIFS